MGISIDRDREIKKIEKENEAYYRTLPCYWDYDHKGRLLPKEIAQKKKKAIMKRRFLMKSKRKGK